MIITLKGADFSQSNIGTLDSWFINWSGSGLTAASGNVASIKKNGTSTTTLTYTYNTENYKYVSGTVKDATGATVGSVSASNGTVTVTINAGNTIGGKITVAINMEYIGTSGGGTPATYTFTINPTPSTATVTLTASGYTQSNNSITAPAGTVISYSVSASGYVTKSGTYTMGSENYTLDVSLEADNMATFTVIPTPSDATVMLYAKGYTQVGNSITVPNNGTIAPTWQVVKDNYLSDGGALSAMTESVTKNITLTPFSSGNWVTIQPTAYEEVANYYMTSSGRLSGPFDSWKYIVVPVTAGKKYRIVSTAGQYALLWTFFNTKPAMSPTDTIVAPISYSKNGGYTMKIADEVVAPAGATYMAVNSRFLNTDYQATIEELN